MNKYKVKYDVVRIDYYSAITGDKLFKVISHLF